MEHTSIAPPETNVVDLAAERVQRRSLARQAEQGPDALISGLQRAGDTLADLAWILAAPVRHRDNDLKEGIYGLLLARLNGIVEGAMEEIHPARDVRLAATEKARIVAFSAFKTRILNLVAAELQEQ